MNPGPVAGRQVVLGTMRIHEKGRSEAEWAELLALAWDRGVRRLHSSSEYDSFAMFRHVLMRLREQRPDVGFEHVVKLAEPSFREDGFDAVRLESRIRDYCAALGVARLDCVQWMWRSDLDSDEKRLADFRASAAAITEATDQLRVAGLIGEFACFPYSRSFAQAAIESELFDGLIVYANPGERDYEPEIGQARGAEMFVDIIRPFGQGRELVASGQPACVYVGALLDGLGARSAILSVSDRAQLDALLPAA